MFKLAEKYKTCIGCLLACFLALQPVSAIAAAKTVALSGRAAIKFSGGSLELLSVPSFDFGRHAKPKKDTYYAAISIGPQPVAIMDTYGRGWKLMARLSPLSDGKSVVVGTTLVFNTTSGNIKPKAGQSPVLLPFTAGQVQIAAGGVAVEVASAPPGRGQGIWTIDWKADAAGTEREDVSTGKDVELKIPATSARLGDFQAQLYWDLANVP